MRYFITGTAGFIGFHLAQRLLSDGHQVVGYDAITDYYDVTLKRARLALLAEQDGYRHVEAHLEDAARLAQALLDSQAQIVAHLAAQAGVRYSIEQPQTYIQANLVGTANLLEALRLAPPQHLLFASSSSVYGGNTRFPFSETDRADFPVSLYAATKKSGEELVHAYAHLWKIPVTCLRFFTVYGPWGRPDMALFKFVGAMARGEPIDVFGQGAMQRDFTYIDDVVEAVVRLAEVPPLEGWPVGPDSLSGVAPFRTVNIAGGRPVPLMDFITAIETALAVKAQRNLLPMQQGDVVRTEADTRLLQCLIGQVPTTSVSTGVARFVAWYRDYYRV